MNRISILPTHDVMGQVCTFVQVPIGAYKIPMQYEPTKIVKEPADDHRYGKDVSRRGGYVYAAYDGDRLIAIGATVKEARRKYREAYEDERGVVRNPDGQIVG